MERLTRDHAKARERRAISDIHNVVFRKLSRRRDFEGTPEKSWSLIGGVSLYLACSFDGSTRLESMEKGERISTRQTAERSQLEKFKMHAIDFSFFTLSRHSVQ